MKRYFKEICGGAYINLPVSGSSLNNTWNVNIVFPRITNYKTIVITKLTILPKFTLDVGEVVDTNAVVFFEVDLSNLVLSAEGASPKNFVLSNRSSVYIGGRIGEINSVDCNIVGSIGVGNTVAFGQSYVLSVLMDYFAASVSLAAYDYTPYFMIDGYFTD